MTSSEQKVVFWTSWPTCAKG